MSKKFINDLDPRYQMGAEYSEEPTMSIKGLQNVMKNQISNLDKLKALGFKISDHGSSYFLKKNRKSLDVPLFAAQEVFKALVTFNMEG